MWYHLLAFKFYNFTKNEREIQQPFVNLCHARGHKPTSMLSVSTLWYDGGDTGENVGTTEMYEKTLELEEHF